MDLLDENSNCKKSFAHTEQLNQSTITTSGSANDLKNSTLNENSGQFVSYSNYNQHGVSSNAVNEKQYDNSSVNSQDIISNSSNLDYAAAENNNLSYSLANNNSQASATKNTKSSSSFSSTISSSSSSSSHSSSSSSSSSSTPSSSKSATSANSEHNKTLKMDTNDVATNNKTNQKNEDLRRAKSIGNGEIQMSSNSFSQSTEEKTSNNLAATATTPVAIASSSSSSIISANTNTNTITNNKASSASSSSKFIDSITSPLSSFVKSTQNAASATSEAFSNFISSSNNNSNSVSSSNLANTNSSPNSNYNASSSNSTSSASNNTFSSLLDSSISNVSGSESQNKKQKQSSSKKSLSSAVKDKPDKPKKPWYSAFINSYKQKNEDFKKQFKLPPTEHLLVDYSCALQREILAHGRLYISLNYVCFHANIIGWETNLSIKLRDIRNLVKDKTAKIIPNAITVILENERYFFTSFASRDRTYTTLFRVWQIACADRSLTSKEISDILKTSYGEDLGYNSDDPDYEYYSQLKSSENNDDDSQENSNLALNGAQIDASSPDTEDIKTKQSSSKKSQLTRLGSTHRHSSSYDASKINLDESNPNDQSKSKRKSIETAASSQNLFSKSIGDNEILHDSLNSNASFSPLALMNKKISTSSPNTATSNQTALNDIEESSNLVVQDSSIEAAKNQKSNASNLNEEDQDSEESYGDEDDDEDQSENVKCMCDKHPGTEMLNQVFDLSVNYLWECIFGHTEFCKKYWESRKFIDLKVEEWNKTSDLPSRKLIFFVDLGPIGKPKNIEDQRILYYKSKQCIVLESESITHGITYSDYFTVLNRFCITKCTNQSSRLVIHSFMNYLKKPNMIAKTIIEKKTMSALRDSYQYLALLINEEFVKNGGFSCHAIEDSNLAKEAENFSQTKQLRHISAFDNRPKPLHATPKSKKAKKTNRMPEHSTHARHSNVVHRTAHKHISTHTNVHANTLNQVHGHVHMRNTNATHTSSNGNNQSNESQSFRSDMASSMNITSSYNNDTTTAVGPPQLVPIQTFSFFRWTINVDTLVRLFIIAMICLMVINGMLYYKLRRIESLADGIRNDPTFASRLSEARVHENSEQITQFNNKDFQKDLSSWRGVISNTLNVIQKMESSLKELDKNSKSNVEDVVAKTEF